MLEAVRTMASPAATWTIVVVATVLALFMASVAMFTDLQVAREQRRERRLGIPPEAGDAWAMEAGSEWPRLSQALLAAAGVPPREATQIRSGAPTADAAGHHDIPAQRMPAEQPAFATQRAGAAGAAGQEAEPPTVPIPVQRAQPAPGPREAAAGRGERGAEGSPGETTRPDLPAQRAPGQPAVQMPAQRSGESDRAERSFAGPSPQDEDEGEQ